MTKRHYDCDNCPAYCCTYENVEITDTDLARLARRFELDVRTAERRFTKKSKDGERPLRVLRHRDDKIFGTACRFFDPESRECGIYAARPSICRRYPGTGRCGFYDFLCAERRSQEDPDYIPSFTRG